MPQNTETNSKKRRNPAPIDNTYGHLQPQALDIERVVLGALMIDKDAFSLVSEILKPESFYSHATRKSIRPCSRSAWATIPWTCSLSARN